MTKKKKTFKKFINEQVLGVKQKEKQFDKFEDFIKDTKGIKPPENKAETFQEFINEAKGYEFDNDSVDKFDNMVLESKIEQEKQKLEERKTRIDPSPIVLTNRQIEEMNRRMIIDEINEVLKHRDPVLDKMSFQQWLNIPHNKFVFELDEYQAKRLYEQDMSRVEKYEELKKKSGGGKIKVTTEDPFTPADLVVGPNDYYWNPDSLNATLSDGDQIASYPSSAGNFTLTQTYYAYKPQFVKDHTWSAGKTASGFGHMPGPMTLSTKMFSSTIPLTAGSSGGLDAFTIATVVKAVHSTAFNSGDFPAVTTVGDPWGSSSKYVNSYRTISTYGWYDDSTGADTDFETVDGGAIRSIFTTFTATEQRVVIPQISEDHTKAYTPIPVPDFDWWAVFGTKKGPVIYGETLILNYVISDAQRAQLQAYWADKYGA